MSLVPTISFFTSNSAVASNDISNIYVGMRIREEIVHDFFKAYASQLGFAIRKEGKNDYLSFLCVHAGAFRDTRELPVDVTPKDSIASLTGHVRKRVVRTRRTGCQWKVRATLNDNGEYIVSIFTDGHNHALNPFDRLNLKGILLLNF